MIRLKLLISIFFLALFVFVPMVNTSAQIANIKTRQIYPRTMGTVPAGTNPVYSGIKIVARGMLVYLTADTTGGVNSFAWTLSGPTESTTTMSSTNTQNVTFVPDSVGSYIINLTVNGGSVDADTFFVSTYIGATTCLTCHTQLSPAVVGWQQTPHANIFAEGVQGQLEVAPVNGQQMGVYSISRCAKCHTTGYDQSANNGNFGYLSHKSGYDTAWAATYTLSNGEYYIPQGDSTAWNLLTTNATYSNAAPVANIGCETCHGPGAGHKAAFDPKKISMTLDAGVCLQCHDAPTHHTIGTYYEASNHATMPLAGSHATSTSCFPCHSGSAYFKYTKSQSAPGYSTADASQNITCAVCHDPHTAANFGLRLVPITLKNGYSVPSSVGGNGQLCMTCHQSRKNIATTITNAGPYYGFSDRFGPHHGPQADMFLGQNAYQYGDSSLTGLMTHSSVTDACVTCHMANIGGGNSPSHQWNMTDTTGGTAKDLVGACVSCHGPITSFNDIMASADWDGNGKIEGVQTEVQGMLTNLAALLPKDSTGAVVTMMADSLKVKGQPNIVKGIYTYYFVTEDKSLGVHNAKYTVAILQAALSALGKPLGVAITKTNPTGFMLSQNYPNPFNPSTSIRYTLPKESNVKVVIYNVTGAVVKTLVNGIQSSGYHETVFNTNNSGTQISSGIYFYSIEAVALDGSKIFRDTKKMVLMK